MLVLSRNPGQTIVIGEGENRILVTVTSVDGEHVKLGIAAPLHVPVHRSEIYERIQKERGLVPEPIPALVKRPDRPRPERDASPTLSLRNRMA